MLTTEQIKIAHKIRRLSGRRPHKERLQNKLEFIEVDGVKLLRRRARTIPYGWKESKAHEGYLEPVELELKALEKAEGLVKSGCTLAATAGWLTKVTNRKVSAYGLQKILRDRRY